MPAIFAGYSIRIHRKEDLLDADYLTYFLNSQDAFDYGKTVVISSVNQANINGTKRRAIRSQHLLFPNKKPSLPSSTHCRTKPNVSNRSTGASSPR